MGLLEGLLGAMGPQGAGDFIRRYERGAPWDGIDDREALDHYGRVAGALGPEEYRQSAEDAFSRFSPDERRQLGQHLAQQARRQDFSVGEPDPGRLDDPRELADMTSRLHGAGPGVLRGLLGAGGGGALSNPLAKAALAGIAAMAMKRVMGSGGR